MTIKDFVEKFSENLKSYLGLSFFMIGQNLETKDFQKWGTVQILNVDYKLTNKKNVNGVYSKFWTLVVQLNVNSKYDTTAPNAFEAMNLASKIVHYLSMEYYFSDGIDTKTHYPVEVSSINDLTKTDLQKTIYTKTLDITFKGVETFEFLPVEIDKVAGSVIEEVSGEVRLLEVEDV